MGKIILAMLQISAIGMLALVIFVVALFWGYFIAIFIEEIIHKWSGS